jgi:hypothetical protein
MAVASAVLSGASRDLASLKGGAFALQQLAARGQRPVPPEPMLWT